MLHVKGAWRAIVILGLAAFASVNAQDTYDYSLPADASNLIAAGKTGAQAQTQINAAQDASRVVYLPAGTYDVSATLGGTQGYYRFMTIWGAGPGKTVLKLRDNCAGFTDSINPKPVVMLYYSNNATHSCFIRNLTIDVGKGNYGAIGIEYNSHNGGMLDNVIITSQDGMGIAGLSMMNSPGPALVSNLTVTGFKYGIQSAGALYTMTLANVTLQNQRVYGLYNQNVPLSIVNFTSKSAVRAIRSGGAGLSLVNAVITYAGTGTCADVAVSSEACAYVRNLTTSGYSGALRDPNVTLSQAVVPEHISIGLKTAARTAYQSLHLPIKDPPKVAWDADQTHWANVRSFASVQAAMNSGKPVIYFPNLARGQTYSGSATVPATVKRLVGLMTSYSGTITVGSPDSSAAVVIEQLNGMTLNHTGKAKVYVKGLTGATITTKAGAGDLFIDDYCCGKLTVDHTNVWIRQLNIELDASPFILNSGGRLVVMGYKTEKPYTVLQNTNKAATEILGGLVYPVSSVAAGVPMYVNDNSALFLFHSKLIDYPIFVREIRNGLTGDTLQANYICMYASNPDSLGYTPAKPADHPQALAGGTVIDVGGCGGRGQVLVSVKSAGTASYRLSVFSTDGRLVFGAPGQGSRIFRVALDDQPAARLLLAVVFAGDDVLARRAVVW